MYVNYKTTSDAYNLLFCFPFFFMKPAVPIFFLGLQK